jgi:hypothetical protein
VGAWRKRCNDSNSAGSMVSFGRLDLPAMLECSRKQTKQNMFY